MNTNERFKTFREIWRTLREAFAQKKQGNSMETPEAASPAMERQASSAESNEQEIAKQTQVEIDHFKPIWKANVKAHVQKVQEHDERGQKEIGQLATKLESDQSTEEQQPAPLTTEVNEDEIAEQTQAEIDQTKPIWKANVNAHFQNVQKHDQRGQDEINRLATKELSEQGKVDVMKNVTEGLGILSPNTEQAPKTETEKPDLAPPVPDTSKPKQGH